MNDSNTWLVRALAIAVVVVIAALWFWRSRASSTQSLATNWKAFADQVQGQYSESPLQFRKTVTMQANRHVLLLETYSAVDYSPADSTFTYMRVAFAPKRAFELSLQPRNAKAQLESPLTAGEIITTGNDSLDTRYETRSTDAAQARALLSNKAVAQALLGQPSGALSIAPKQTARNQPDPNGQWQVLFGGEESITDIQRLHALRQLVLTMLTQLENMGAA